MRPFGRLPFTVLALALALTPLAAAHFPAPGVPQSGPDVPSATPPVATVVVFDADVWSYTEGVRTRTVTVPDVAFDRVVLTYVNQPAGDPWDRLFGVAVGNVELLHGTTPRTTMVLKKDVTEFMSLFPRGEEIDVRLLFGTWVGAMKNSVSFDFYNDVTSELVAPPADAAVAPFLWTNVRGETSRAVAFPEKAPSYAVIEMTMSGHGQHGEFWYLNAPASDRLFRVLVDGHEVASVRPLPYTYALAGFGDGGNVINTGLWWTAQKGLDLAGVHVNAGEIPPYRFLVESAHLELLAGARTVTLATSGITGDAYWPTSVTFLLTE